MQAVAGDAARWGDTEHLLAGVIDVLQVGNYLTTAAHFKGKPKQPKPILRPGDTPPARLKPSRKYTIEELAIVRKSWAESDPVERTPEVR